MGNHGSPASPAPPRARSWSPARSLLAGLLLAMAAGQASDLGGFAGILADYRIVPDPLVDVAAGTIVAAEAAAGFLLLGARRRGAQVALAVAAVWSLLAVQAFARGLVIENCGCFGVHLGQPLRWWVLIQDAEFLALALWVRRAGRPVPEADVPAPVETGARGGG